MVKGNFGGSLTTWPQYIAHHTRTTARKTQNSWKSNIVIYLSDAGNKNAHFPPCAVYRNGKTYSLIICETCAKIRCTACECLPFFLHFFRTIIIHRKYMYKIQISPSREYRCLTYSSRPGKFKWVLHRCK